MALLNKLFFPSTTTSAPSAAAAAAASASSKSTWTSFTSPNASLSSPTGTSTASIVTTTPSTPSCVNKHSSSNNSQPVHSKNYLSQFPFDGRQVRVLLYRECDGRRLLFDSNALEKVVLKETISNVTREKGHHHMQNNHSGGGCGGGSGGGGGGGWGQKNIKHSNSSHASAFIEVCDEYGYRHNRPTSDDIMSIGEMVFGASAMSFKGTALKIHWLQAPSRILCSQVFLTPINSSNSSNSNINNSSHTGGPSPYSTISMNSLATPRTSISSEHSSVDGVSMNSFSMPYSVNVGRQQSLTPSERSTNAVLTCPNDMTDQQSIISNSSNSVDGRQRNSSTYSTVTDSGYSGMSRSQLSSDSWSVSYQYSARSSLGSVLSDSMDPLRKLSVDSAFFPGSADKFESIASDGSLQRRICRNLHTSFENENSSNDLIGFLSDHYIPRLNGGSEGGSIGMPNYRRASYCANESRSNPEIGKRRDGNNSKHSSRRAKLGLAVFITLSESFQEEMELFCSEHIALLESMLSRLRMCTERAYVNHKEFYQIMFHSWQTTQQWFSDLFTAPRIKCPVWLSITTSGSKYSKSIAECFMKEFCWLLSFADTKDTNFFISTMLTAILTHHLGWVSTVSAFNSSTTLSEASAVAIEQRAKLQQVSQKHPYNALWAQLGDLYGAIGMPPKLTRTIIYGTEKLSVERLLKILTYFIRCGEVRRSSKREDFNKDFINKLVSENKNEKLRKSSSIVNNIRTGRVKKAVVTGSGIVTGIGSGLIGLGGLTRTQTSRQSLKTISDSFNETDSDSNEEITNINEVEAAALVQNAKKNEIPNVFAFRDSRFVQQELRIGNYLMDTGIEKSSFIKKNGNFNQSSADTIKDGRIRFTVTTPDNIELHVEDDSGEMNFNSEDGALEAIEIDGSDIPESASEGDLTVRKRKSSFLWKMVPETVKDGLSLQSHRKIMNKDCRNSMSNLERFSSKSNRSTEMGNLEKRVSYLSLSDLITQNSIGKSDRMTWGIEPIKENVSLEEQIHFDNSQKLIEKEHGISRNSNRNTNSNTNTNSNSNSNINSSSHKKNKSNIDASTKVEAIEGDDSSSGNRCHDGVGVVFVLGDNEPLINIKKSTEDLSVKSISDHIISALPSSNSNLNANAQNEKRDCQREHLCILHRGNYDAISSNAISSTTTTTTTTTTSTITSSSTTTISTMTHSKKHAGVKFNFQQYPQIATNYMKSKNLVMSNYDLLMEKCTKLEAADAADAMFAYQTAHESDTMKTNQLNASTSTSSALACIVCSGNGAVNSYQTPSNATELEFETDEEHSYNNNNAAPTSTATITTILNSSIINNNNSSTRTLQSANSATSIDTIKSATNLSELQSAECTEIASKDDMKCTDSELTNSITSKISQTPQALPSQSQLESQSQSESQSSSPPTIAPRSTYCGNVKRISSHRGSISSVAAKCAAANEAVHLLKLPVPGVKELPQDEDPPDNMKLRAGFIPSLFLNVSDHYISDVVLQGTFASPQKWESSLREDLALSAHSASLISLPVENIGIIADMENWDVRLVSSQTQCFPSAGVQSAPVGMSQLVSSMLEAVQAMNTSGIPAYECLSFLESKLQEIYLQSETLAAFLLETDFCSLSAVTSALNLTENDVPLLLSIASIHTPQISKKCGISFR